MRNNHSWEGRETIQLFAIRMVSEYGVEAGEDTVRALHEEAGGMRIRLPTTADLERHQRGDRIRLLFDGRNHQELALRFELPEMHIRRILEKGEF